MSQDLDDPKQDIFVARVLIKKPQKGEVNSQSDTDNSVIGITDRLRKTFPADGDATAAVCDLKNTFTGMPIPLALARLASAWLGTSNPTGEALIARFGVQPGEEALHALAKELKAEMTIHTDGGANKNRRMLEAPTPFIAELVEGGTVIVSAFLADGTVECLTANGKQSSQLSAFHSATSGNWLSVYQALSIGNTQDNVRPETKNLGTSKKHVRRLLALAFKGNRKSFTKLFIAAALSNSLLVALPLFITIVYDRVVPHGAFETLTALTIGVMLALGIDIGLRAARINLQESIGVKTSLRLQAALYRKLVTIPLERSEKTSKGFFSMLPEIDQAALLTPGVISSLTADVPFVLVMLALVYSLTGPVVLVPVIGIVAIIIIVGWSNFKVKRNSAPFHKARVELQDQAIETCATLATTKATRAEHKMLNQWERRTDTNAFLGHKSRQSSVLSSQLVLNVTQMTIVMTIVSGAVQVNAGMMTLGSLAAATLLVGRIISPVSQLISQFGQFSNMQASINSVFALLDEVEETGGDENSSSLVRFNGDINLTNVTFRYPDSEHDSLKDITVHIQPGERVGIIGRNGGGKSTLLKLVPRFYAPQQGAMMFDGVDARQISPFVLRQNIGYMGQDTVLMNNTLRANICAGIGEVDEETFERAVRLSGVASFAKRHPAGFNLKVGPRGEHLSGGERQAVGLARTILQNPSVLILDEPTSAMDNSAEDQLIKELPSFIEGKTLILATHRMQLLKLVDRVIWMDNGRIVADGPKEIVLSSLRKTG